MLAAALERAIEENKSAGLKIAPGTREQTLGNLPWRDVDHVGAEHRHQPGGATAAIHLGAPGGIGQIDPQRRTDIRKLRMRAPRLDAFEMLLVEIARPPGHVRKMMGEVDDMLAGAAADFDGIARLSREKLH